MLSDDGDVRKQLSSYVNLNGLLSRRRAQINFKIHKAVTLLEGHDFWYVQMRRIQEIELASKIKIEEPLHSTVGCDNTGLHTGVAQALLRFNPFFVVPNPWSAEGDGKPLHGYIF